MKMPVLAAEEMVRDVAYVKQSWAREFLLRVWRYLR